MTNPASSGGDERPPPARETTERFEPTPAFDALAAEVPLAEPIGGGASTLAPEADYPLAPAPTDAGREASGVPRRRPGRRLAAGQDHIAREAPLRER
jgi:hypothetical protein